MTGLRWIVVAVALMVGAGTAAADQIGVLPFEGKGAKPVRARVIRVLEQKKHDAIDVDRIGELPEAVAYVRGTVDRKRGKWRLRVQIIDARSGRTLATVQMLARRRGQLPRQVSRLLWRRARPALRKARPARGQARAEAKAEAKAQAKAKAEAEARAEAQAQAQAKDDAQAQAQGEAKGEAQAKDEAGGDGDAMAVSGRARAGEQPKSLRVGLESRLYSRRLRYRDDLFEALYGHTSDGTVEVAGHADYDITPWLSAGGHVALTRPFDSTLDGNPFRTGGAAYAAGAHLHLPSQRIGVGVYVGSRSLTFDAAGDAMERPPLPDVRYRFARAGVDGRQPVGGAVEVGAGAGYRYVYAAGMIASDAYFPRLDVAAVDGALWLAYRLNPTWRVRAGLELERYFFTMNPEPGDTNVAGGAIDQYIGLGVRLEVAPF